MLLLMLITMTASAEKGHEPPLHGEPDHSRHVEQDRHRKEEDRNPPAKRRFQNIEYGNYSDEDDNMDDDLRSLVICVVKDSWVGVSSRAMALEIIRKYHGRSETMARGIRK